MDNCVCTIDTCIGCIDADSNLEYVVLAHNHEEASALEDQLTGLLTQHDS